MLKLVEERLGTKTRHRSGAAAVICLLAAAAIALPWFGNDYHISFLFFLFIAITMVETYDIVAGYMGYINLGHGAFFGVGAYAYGITIVYFQNNAVGVISAVVVAVVLAGIIAYPLFRLRGAYFSIATFGVLKVLAVLAFNLRDLTGGSTGLSIPPTDSRYITYYLGFAICVAAIALNTWIAHSGMGLGLLAIREDEEVAEASGVRTTRIKWLVLVLSAALPGFAGAVYMWQLTYIDPDSAFGSSVAFAPVIMAMLGGSGTVIGPIVGAITLTFIQEVLWSHIGYLQLTMYGVVLILVGMFMPGGLYAQPATLTALYRDWFQRSLRLSRGKTI